MTDLSLINNYLEGKTVPSLDYLKDQNVFIKYQFHNFNVKAVRYVINVKSKEVVISDFLYKTKKLIKNRSLVKFKLIFYKIVC